MGKLLRFNRNDKTCRVHCISWGIIRRLKLESTLYPLKLVMIREVECVLFQINHTSGQLFLYFHV